MKSMQRHQTMTLLFHSQMHRMKSFQSTAMKSCIRSMVVQSPATKVNQNGAIQMASLLMTAGLRMALGKTGKMSMLQSRSLRLAMMSMG